MPFHQCLFLITSLALPFRAPCPLPTFPPSPLGDVVSFCIAYIAHSSQDLSVKIKIKFDFSTSLVRFKKRGEQITNLNSKIQNRKTTTFFHLLFPPHGRPGVFPGYYPFFILSMAPGLSRAAIQCVTALAPTPRSPYVICWSPILPGWPTLLLDSRLSLYSIQSRTNSKIM
jgi:hypothetical protein